MPDYIPVIMGVLIIAIIIILEQIRKEIDEQNQS